MRFKIMVLCLWGLSNIEAIAQTVVAKTNLLYDVIGIPSLGVEMSTSKHTSLGMIATCNPFAYSGRKWKNYSFQPEFRYWFHRDFTGPYVSANACLGGFNIDKIHVGGLYGKHRQGHFGGAGLGAGYSLIISNRCNLDFSVVCDVVYSRYDRYREGAFPYKEGRFSSTAIVPIGTGISLVYIIK